MHKKLFIPGPVDVREDVLKAMGTPMIGHRSAECSELQKECAENMQKIMKTKNDIVFSTSSGSGLMEAAIRSCTKKRAIVFSVGAFGNRWHQMAEANNVPADKHEVEWGNAITPELIEEYLSTGKYDLMTITHNETSTGIMNPVKELSEVWKKYPDVVVCMDTVSSMGGVEIPVDDLAVDVCMASTQKALGLPAGLALASVSEKAIERAKTVENRGFYLDLLKLIKYVRERNHQYPSTPSIEHLFALRYQLRYILNEEGIESRYKRHKEMADYTREWAKKYFEIFPNKEEWASNTLTTIKNTKGFSVADLNKELGKRGFVISNGYGALKEKTFRVAHMADTSFDSLKEVLSHIEDIWDLK